MEEWNAVDSLENTTLINVNDWGSGVFARVEFVPTIPGFPDRIGHLDSNICSDPSKRLWLATNLLQTNGAYRDVARHEMGHLLGLQHTGRSDSYGPRPTMNTCLSSPGTDSSRTLTKDDEAAAFYFNQTDSPNSIFDSDPGFESGTLSSSFSSRSWVRVGSSFTTNYAPFEGSSEAILPWDGSGISQLINLNASGNYWVQVELTYRTEGPPTGTAILITLSQADYDYPSGSSNCSWKNGTPNTRYNLSASWGPTVSHGWVWRPTRSTYATENWLLANTNQGSLGDLDSENLRINVTHWNSIGHMEVDNVLLK